jgi:hypothetical protein
MLVFASDAISCCYLKKRYPLGYRPSRPSTARVLLVRSSTRNCPVGMDPLAPLYAVTPARASWILCAKMR